jgi:hypothetical protein
LILLYKVAPQQVDVCFLSYRQEVEYLYKLLQPTLLQLLALNQTGSASIFALAAEDIKARFFFSG